MMNLNHPFLIESGNDIIKIICISMTIKQPISNIVNTAIRLLITYEKIEIKSVSKDASVSAIINDILQRCNMGSICQ